MHLPIHEDMAHFVWRALCRPRRLVRGLRPLRDMPEYVWIEITRRCNIRCRSCEKFYGAGDSDTDIDFGVFERLLAEIGPTAESVNLTGVGEALFHRRAPEIFERLAEYPHLIVEFTTNGQLVDETWVRRLSRIRSIVTFSVDGVSQETYRFNRPKADLERVKAALAMARERETRSGDPASFPFKRRINFLVMRRTLAEIPGIVEWGARYGCSAVVLNLMGNWGAPDAFWQEQNPLNYRRELHARLAEARERARELGVELVAPHVSEREPEAAATRRSSRGWLRVFRPGDMTLQGYPRFEKAFCRLPFESMYIHVDGRVSVCCGAEWYPRVLGSVSRRSAREVWNGWPYRLLRARMLIGSHTPYCRSCPLPHGLGAGNPHD